VKISLFLIVFFALILPCQFSFGFTRQDLIKDSLRKFEINRTLDEFEKKINAPEDLTLCSYSSLFRQEKGLFEDIRKFLGENLSLTVGIQPGYLIGDTTYHIRFRNPLVIGGVGESELEWEFNNFLMGISTSLAYRDSDNYRSNQDRSVLDIEWFTNIDKKAGKLKDSDWIQNDVGYIDWTDDGLLNGSAAWAWNNPGKDLYGELDAYVDYASIFKVQYLYNVFMNKKISLGVLGGYRHNKFEFYGKNLSQRGYGPHRIIIANWRAGVSDETLAEKWIKYDSKHEIPYLGIGAGLSLFDTLDINLKFGYSDWVKLKDKDTHLYPDFDAANPGNDLDMVSESTCHGIAYLVDLTGKWRFLPNWTLSLGTKYEKVDTEGTLNQAQYLNGAVIAAAGNIDDSVKSEYWLIKSDLTYTF